MTRYCVALVGLGLAVVVGFGPLIGDGAPPAKDKDGKRNAPVLRAGVAKVEITDKQVIPTNDPLYVKALVLEQSGVRSVIITVDAVAIGEIGTIRNDYLSKVRTALKQDPKIDPGRVVVNASHCHGRVCRDVDAKTIEAVRLAAKNLVPVKVGVGVGHEDGVQANRRLKLKSGKVIDERHAYSLPPDEEVAGVGPIDPQIGVLRLDKADDKPLAIVYNFACHPIMGLPNGENTADLVGFASKVIEESFGGETLALFLQGCAGDINPVGYKDVDSVRNAEPLGNKLGLSVMRAARRIECVDPGKMILLNEKLTLPRADLEDRIDSLLLEQSRLVKSLRGTSLNLKSFLPLVVKYNLAETYPSTHAHRYLHEKQVGREHLDYLDRTNRRNLEAYIRNIHTMEQLTRVNTNLALLQKHRKRYLEAGRKPIEVEVVGCRIGEFVMVTFPGELTVEIGLRIKKMSPHKKTFVAGYTNGYIYYTPTAEQLENVGGAQEDSDCLVSPEWQKLFEAKAASMLKGL